MYTELISIILNLVLGGSLIVTIATLKSTRKTAQATAKEANAKAESIEIDNDIKISENLNKLIVEPLKKEINALRNDVSRLQKALEKVSKCPHADKCPVCDELQNYSYTSANSTRG